MKYDVETLDDLTAHALGKETKKKEEKKPAPAKPAPAKPAPAKPATPAPAKPAAPAPKSGEDYFAPEIVQERSAPTPKYTPASFNPEEPEEKYVVPKRPYAPESSKFQHRAKPLHPFMEHPKPLEKV